MGWTWHIWDTSWNPPPREFFSRPKRRYSNSRCFHWWRVTRLPKHWSPWSNESCLLCAFWVRVYLPMSSRNSKISEKRGHQSPISWIENALRLLFGGFPGLDHLLGWRDMSVSLYISNVLTPRSPIAQNWRETSDETRMIYQPELSVVIGGYASFLSNQFQCCRARSFIHIHRIRWVKNKSRRFYSEVPYDLFNLHLSNDSFTSMRSAGSVKISLHIILFTHFKPIWGTYFGALIFPAEKKTMT